MHGRSRQRPQVCLSVRFRSNRPIEAYIDMHRIYRQSRLPWRKREIYHSSDGFISHSFADVDLSRGLMECDVRSASFMRCSFVYAKFSETAANNTMFESCDFRNASFDKCILDRATIRDCDGLGATFASCQMEYVVFDKGRLAATRFVNCNLNGTSFRYVKLFAPKSTLIFHECDLSNSIFDNCSFNMFSFVSCNLSGASLGGSICELHPSDQNYVNCKFDENTTLPVHRPIAGDGPEV